MSEIDWVVIYITGYFVSLLLYIIANRYFEYENTLTSSLVWSMLSWLIVALVIITVLAIEINWSKFNIDKSKLGKWFERGGR